MEDKFGDLVEQRLFKTEKDTGLTETDIQLAAAILMFEVIMSDGHVDRMEIAEMVEILRKQFGLGGEEIGRILEQVRTANGEKLELNPFSAKLRQYWGDDQRLRLLNNLWIIALADRVIDDGEQLMIGEIAMSLGLSADDIEHAKTAAKDRLDLNITSF